MSSINRESINKVVITNRFECRGVFFLRPEKGGGVKDPFFFTNSLKECMSSLKSASFALNRVNPSIWFNVSASEGLVPWCAASVISW